MWWWWWWMGVLMDRRRMAAETWLVTRVALTLQTWAWCCVDADAMGLIAHAHICMRKYTQHTHTHTHTQMHKHTHTCARTHAISVLNCAGRSAGDFSGHVRPRGGGVRAGGEAPSEIHTQSQTPLRRTHIWSVHAPSHSRTLSFTQAPA